MEKRLLGSLGTPAWMKVRAVSPSSVRCQGLKLRSRDFWVCPSMISGRSDGRRKGFDIATFVSKIITAVIKRTVKTRGLPRHGLGGNKKTTLCHNQG